MHTASAQRAHTLLSNHIFESFLSEIQSSLLSCLPGLQLCTATMMINQSINQSIYQISNLHSKEYSEPQGAGLKSQETLFARRVRHSDKKNILAENRTMAKHLPWVRISRPPGLIKKIPNKMKGFRIK
jgi:hypothetical protein